MHCSQAGETNWAFISKTECLATKKNYPHHFGGGFFSNHIKHFNRTTAWMQEIVQRMEQLPRGRGGTQRMDLNKISGIIIDSAMKVHTVLGSGLLESAYEACLKHELIKRGLKVASQVGLPVTYDNVTIDIGYRLDLLVEDTVIIELKAVERLNTIHEAQLLSYLKLSDKKLGLLINFNVTRLKYGIKRLVNNI